MISIGHKLFNRNSLKLLSHSLILVFEVLNNLNCLISLQKLECLTEDIPDVNFKGKVIHIMARPQSLLNYVKINIVFHYFTIVFMARLRWLAENFAPWLRKKCINNFLTNRAWLPPSSGGSVRIYFQFEIFWIDILDLSFLLRRCVIRR